MRLTTLSRLFDTTQTLLAQPDEAANGLFQQHQRQVETLLAQAGELMLRLTVPTLFGREV